MKYEHLDGRNEQLLEWYQNERELAHIRCLPDDSSPLIFYKEMDQRYNIYINFIMNISIKRINIIMTWIRTDQYSINTIEMIFSNEQRI
jgi:hypothetical protein